MCRDSNRALPSLTVNCLPLIEIMSDGSECGCEGRGKFGLFGSNSKNIYIFKCVFEYLLYYYLFFLLVLYKKNQF